jgi:2-oxoisovalerate dehydrogenase E1 component
MSKVSTQKKRARFSKKRKEEILKDYRLGWLSRHVSVLGRKEVLSGKAKFGIFGDGKELPQLAMAKVFENGDFRSGYYRDQTFMFAIGEATLTQFFAQLYAHPDVQEDPFSAGRQMNSHFGSRLIDEEGSWVEQVSRKNSVSGISPTAGQMARITGLAQASKIYRSQKKLQFGKWKKFSNKGNEVVFGTIGDASTSEGVFWETMNTLGVLQAPAVISVWDDGYGISVPKKFQTTKESISEALSGMQHDPSTKGIEILKVKGWDYEDLIDTYTKATELARSEHVPVLIHVEELTQPLGHSSSGSHERYKTKERLEWESDYCCLQQFRKWILAKKIATETELDSLELEAQQEALAAKQLAWQQYIGPIKQERDFILSLLHSLKEELLNTRKEMMASIEAIMRRLKSTPNPIRKDIVSSIHKALRSLGTYESTSKEQLVSWLEDLKITTQDRYHSHLYSQSPNSPLQVKHIAPSYDDKPIKVDGRIVIRDNFRALFDKYPELLTFGEDVGVLGDVNKGLEGLQEEFGDSRVMDTGIREATIIGQGIGMAIRGLRPIPEIQYLDYIYYALFVLSDDLATLRYRTKGGQASPVIIRTRGHRLEGIWHSGSPMATLLGSLRGVHLCVPRNLTEAAGMYNTLLKGDDPAIMVEPLNGYRLKEDLPNNLGEFTIPLGISSLLTEGDDLTLVSYGATLNIAKEVVSDLKKMGIGVDLIDLRTLLPFDLNGLIRESLSKTNKLLIVDEDVPGGASAYILQNVLQQQKGFYLLDAAPVCLSAKAHRPAYSSDGDYFSKPNAEDIFNAAYEIMQETNPEAFPPLF